MGRDKFELMPPFCYIGNCLSSGGDCVLSTITRYRVAWGKFNELLSVLTSRSFPITFRRRVYSSCVRSVMLYARETWTPTLSDLHCMQRNGRAKMWIAGCVVSPPRTKSARRISWGGCSLTLRTRQLRWYGHVEYSDVQLKKFSKLNLTGGRGPGHPKKTWTEVINMDCLALGLTETHLSDRKAWSVRLRPAVRLDPPQY